MSDRPDFLIICTHGRRDHARSGTPVAQFTWSSQVPEWVPLPGSSIRIEALYGDEYAGLSPERQFPGYEPSPDDEQLRTHIELVCPTGGCTQRAFRCSDNEQLQALLTLIAARAGTTDGPITMTLTAVQEARDTADKQGLLSK
ncbi:MAG: hypothetical protein WA942_03220 [Mycolicibacter sinensis]